MAHTRVPWMDRRSTWLIAAGSITDIAGGTTLAALRDYEGRSSWPTVEAWAREFKWAQFVIFALVFTGMLTSAVLSSGTHVVTGAVVGALTVSGYWAAGVWWPWKQRSVRKRTG